MMDGMAYCDLCEMDRNYCEHGLAKRAGNPAVRAGTASAALSWLRQCLGS